MSSNSVRPLKKCKRKGCKKEAYGHAEYVEGDGIDYPPHIQ